MHKAENQVENVWTIDEWAALERRTRLRALRAGSEVGAWRELVKQARRVMRAYTTSFFIVSRFLPPAKCAQVEAIYAAVRYPDEVVDSFPLSPAEQTQLIDRWEANYELGLNTRSITEALQSEVPCFLASFTQVVRDSGIPAEHYRAFLNAMRRDITPSPFQTLDHLIDDYIYGSAVVVGFFLTHVYGSRTEADFGRALDSARSLGIALQLTNFLRDVAEDQQRGRVYLPQEMLFDAGVEELKAHDESQQQALAKVLRQLARVAENYYASASAGLDAFSPDCRLAIQACIKVYGRLNERIAQSTHGTNHRESVPLREKFQALPASKYWRIPLAYLVR